MMDELMFPISANPDLCVKCLRCQVFCHSHAVFFKDQQRYVDYRKCKGCLRCVEACEHGAIEVISLDKGELQGFKIDNDRCKMCGQCVAEDFCLQNLFEIKTVMDENGKRKQIVHFNDGDLSKCRGCLKCFKDCPNNAIIPIIEEKD